MIVPVTSVKHPTLEGLALARFEIEFHQGPMIFQSDVTTQAVQSYYDSLPKGDPSQVLVGRIHNGYYVINSIKDIKQHGFSNLQAVYTIPVKNWDNLKTQLSVIPSEPEA